jgi:hypothetical protein
MKNNRVITFLQRKGARETWEYERVVILLLELACLVAGVLASPSRTTMLLMAIDLPRSLYATELARAVRSGAARKAERAKAMGIPEVELACSRDIERAAKNQQLMTAAQPVVGLALSVAGSGQGFTRAIIVGFIVSVIRWASVEVYGVWRAWYRERVPVQVTRQSRDLTHALMIGQVKS